MIRQLNKYQNQFLPYNNSTRPKMTTNGKIDYYKALQLQKIASQQQIKQAYKRLALIHHPDKNDGAQHSKIKFLQISQAYSVLNDPKKRDTYDKYGVVDLQGLDFQQFMSNFGEFDDFLTQILSFNNFDAMFHGMNKRGKRGARIKTRGKGRNKNLPLSVDINQFADMIFGQDIQSSLQLVMMEALLKGENVNDKQIKKMEKQLQKIILQSDHDQDDDQDLQDLTEQQTQILKFGQTNIQKKKVGKKKNKTEIRCKFDNKKIEQDQILLHFSQNHMKQFKKWQKQNQNQQKSLKTNNKQQQIKITNEQIQY